MESRAACARSRSSAASAAVTRTPTVRARRSCSSSRGLAMLSLPAFLKGSRGLLLARVYVKHKHILLLIKISYPVVSAQGQRRPWFQRLDQRLRHLTAEPQPLEEALGQYK